MLTQQEFEVILEDTSKVIHGDIEWIEDEDHSPSVEFIATIESESGWPLFVKGTYNTRIRALSFSVVYHRSARIYGLDLGKRHRNPDGKEVGETHKHRWTEAFRDKSAYEPEDITATADEPLKVWAQFCLEFHLSHNGKMIRPMEKGLFDND